MQKYILRRLVLMVPVWFGVTILVFFLIRLIPGDFAQVLLGEYATPEALAQLRQQYGLDQPIVVQYGVWLWHVFQFDLGTSIRLDKPIFAEILRGLPVTIELASFSAIVSLAASLPLAMLSAVRQNSVLDYFVRFVSMLGLAIPNFWLATLMVVFFAVWFGYVPPIEYKDFAVNPLRNLEQLVMPSLALGVSFAAVLMRIARSSLLEVMRQDYIRTASAKGLSERMVVTRHALKNAMIPVVTLFGLQFARLLGGTVVMEQIFTIPGIGRMVFDAIRFRDYPLLQGTVLFFTTVIVLSNVIVDITYGWFDPRIRYS